MWGIFQFPKTFSLFISSLTRLEWRQGFSCTGTFPLIGCSNRTWRASCDSVLFCSCWFSAATETRSWYTGHNKNAVIYGITHHVKTLTTFTLTYIIYIFAVLLFICWCFSGSFLLQKIPSLSLLPLFCTQDSQWWTGSASVIKRD